MVEADTVANGDSGESERPEVREPAQDIGVGNILSAQLRVALPVLSATPLVVVGIILLASDEVTPWASWMVMASGLLVLLGGFYFGFLGIRPSLGLLPGEAILVLRHPSMKPAFTRMIISLVFFGAALYLLYTPQSYPIYYFALFLIAVYLYFRGIIQYWLNHHTTYYVTDRRIVRLRRFIAVSTTEIPTKAINAISETRGLSEALSGRGSVVVASGIGNLHKLRVQEIDDPGPVARTIRELVTEG